MSIEAPTLRVYPSRASFLNGEQPLHIIDVGKEQNQPNGEVRLSLPNDVQIPDGAFLFFHGGSYAPKFGDLFYSLEPSTDQLATWELSPSGAVENDVLTFDGHNWIASALPPFYADSSFLGNGTRENPLSLNLSPMWGQPNGLPTLNTRGQLNYTQIFVLQRTAAGQTSSSATIEYLANDLAVRDTGGNVYPAAESVVIPLSSITRLDICNTDGAVLTSAWVSPGDVWRMSY